MYVSVRVCNIRYCNKSNASDIARARSREEVMQILFFCPFLSSLLIPCLLMVTWA